ncbi:MAG TPA: hypothetical protein VG448_06485 [Solirubrobacterales bacterium]|nr:hypothetical protein [Solirubrobacterales bacterium]
MRIPSSTTGLPSAPSRRSTPRTSSRLIASPRTQTSPRGSSGFALRADLRELREAIESYLEIAEMNVRGATLYLTGGMSWGDSPTEIWNVIARLRSVRGVLTAAGFENES